MEIETPDIPNLRERLMERHGIQSAYFDLDDTLTQSGNKLIIPFVNIEDKIHEVTGIERGQISDLLMQVILKFRERHSVNPYKWHEYFNQSIEAVVTYKETLREPLNQEEIVVLQTTAQEVTEDLFTRMTTPIDVIPEAVVALEQLKSANIPFAIVTHADGGWFDGWTEKKLSVFPEGLIDPENVFCTPFWIPKNELVWRIAVSGAESSLGISRENSILFGDNIKSDISPGLAIGIGHAALVTRYGKQNGSLPEGVHLGETAYHVIRDLVEEL